MDRRHAALALIVAMVASGFGWSWFAIAIARGADTVWVVLALTFAIITSPVPAWAISVLRGEDPKSLMDE